MELWDIYDRRFQKTGRLHERGKVLAEGDYHLVVHIYPINKNKEVLVQKRSTAVEWFPGVWAATGGSAVEGEDAWQACFRELKEELGIEAMPEQTELAAMFIRKDSFNFVWVIRMDIPPDEFILQKEEVQEVTWMTFAQIQKMIEQGIFHRYMYMDWLEHYIMDN